MIDWRIYLAGYGPYLAAMVANHFCISGMSHFLTIMMESAIVEDEESRLKREAEEKALREDPAFVPTSGKYFLHDDRAAQSQGKRWLIPHFIVYIDSDQSVIFIHYDE